jgi:hypothetical protein
MAKKKETCNKRRYASKAEAAAAIAGMSRKWAFVYKRPYRCAKCKAWHITGTPRRPHKRIRW